MRRHPLQAAELHYKKTVTAMPREPALMRRNAQATCEQASSTMLWAGGHTQQLSGWPLTIPKYQEATEYMPAARSL